MVEKKLAENAKLLIELKDRRENVDDNNNKKKDNISYSKENKKRRLSLTPENRKKKNSINDTVEEERAKFSKENNEKTYIKDIIRSDVIIMENKAENLEIFKKEKEEEELKKNELIYSENSNNNIVKFHKVEPNYNMNESTNIKKKEMCATKKDNYKKKKMKKEKKIRMKNSIEDSLSEHHEAASLKVNYKIHKKSVYEKQKKKSYISIALEENQYYVTNISSICTDNVKFLNFLDDCEVNTYYIKGPNSYNKGIKKKKKKIIKKEENYDTKETLDNYILNIGEKTKYTDNYVGEKEPQINTSLNHYSLGNKEDTSIIEADQEQKKKSKNEKRLNSYSTTIKKSKSTGFSNHVKNAIQNRRRLSFFPNKTLLRKRKEKIIIFLNHNYSVWENGRFNDHFYRTIHKNCDLENLEEEKILIHYHKDSKIKKLIYRIFPQFSIFSLLLYVTFIQWLLFISLISLKSDFPLTPSNDSLKNFGSNFPHDIFQKSEFYRLFTSLFLHSNFNHICANTYVQLTVGFLLEYLYGTFTVFLVYVFTGIYGIILSSPLTYCYSTTESSSSSSGIIGMFFSEILMMTNFNVDKVSISVHLFCFFLLLLFLKFSLNTVSINIYSHFFGFLGGFLIGIILKRKQLKYFFKNNFLVQILCSIFLIISLAASIFISTFVVQKC